MRSIVLDTNVLIDHIHSFAPWVSNFLESGGTQLIIPTIVIAEYSTDIQMETELGRKRSEEYLSWFSKQPLNEEIAGILGSLLRRKAYSQGAGLADLIIASTALYLDAELATRNKSDFDRIPHLKFFNPNV